MTETIGQRLNRERTTRGMSQRELAVQVHVGFPHISKVEHDKETPSDVLLTRIADVFHLDPDELILVAGRVPVQYVDAMAADPRRALRSLRHLRARHEMADAIEGNE